MKNIKLLIVDDDEITRENICEYLNDKFEYIYEASNAHDAYKLYLKYKPDIIITDIQMPKVSGLDLVQRIREKDSLTQIIIISAYSHKEYLLKSIELSLVKYLIKPVSENDLISTLNTCCKNIVKESIYILKDKYSFDYVNKNLYIDKTLIKLRAKEIALLELLLKNKNRYVSYEEIEAYVWCDDVMSKDAIKTLVKNLKGKLPQASISNLSGSGYKIEC